MSSDLTEAEQNRLILEHLTLPKAIALEFKGAQVELDELIATGNLALVEAGRKFKNEGWFADYASRAIRNAIINFIERDGWFPDDEIGEAAELIEGSLKEKIWEWGSWGQHQATIAEAWTELDGTSPEDLRAKFEEIKDKGDRVTAAMLSLTRLQRRLVNRVYLRGKSIADAAREEQISYFQAYGETKKAVSLVRSVVRRIEKNQLPATRRNAKPPMVRFADAVAQTTKGKIIDK